ncbi:hypothetical protein [Candidatus Enterococcus mansonii]|uniref:MapZ extracellular domain-containing protein n=1 Tax=Candidatus Enterococcus mansonii TaxID=1834181 RepID=A0A242CDC4_9ENTE|nr:hypothetical protein [Enterococcus sp. 4G2_DIV0659]OTO08243.1 hypothetical protein A5880_002513 [Enterococcus sp. 4G2_DIV0659]
MIKSGLVDRGSLKIVIYLIVIICSITVCFLGIKINAKQKHQRKIEYAEATIKNETGKIKQLNEQVRNLYQDQQEEFLIQPLEDSLIIEIERSVIALKSKAEDFGLKKKEFSVDTSETAQNKDKLILKLKDVKVKKKIQNQVTDLLVQEPADWKVNADAVVMNEHATDEKVLKIRNKISGHTSVWHDAIIAFLNEIDAQIKQYSESKQSIDAMIDGEKLTSNANAENFILTFNQVALIKNEGLRKSLVDKLDFIDKQLENPANIAVPTDGDGGTLPPPSE